MLIKEGLNNHSPRAGRQAAAALIFALSAAGAHAALDRRVMDFSAACAEAGIAAPIGSLHSVQLDLLARDRFARPEGSRASGIPHVDGAYELLAEIYRFMREVLEIDSIDGRGMTLQAVAGVRFYDEYVWPQCVGDKFSAMWNSLSQSAYIPGAVLPYTEVVAHEIAHGIIDNGSQLIYEGESGALNEAISDAVGVGFRAWQWAGGTADYSPPRFAAFPELWKLRKPGGTIRNMRAPKSVHRLYPDHYADIIRGGDVHLNSSIINQAFYILSEGGRHPRLGRRRGGPDVQGIGVQAAVRIYAHAGFHLLTPRSDFKDARYAFAHAAALLYGGKHSPAWAAVHEAMDAVGIPGAWPRHAPPATRSAPSPSSTATTANPPDIRLWVYLIFSALLLAPVLWLLKRMRPGQSKEPSAEPSPTPAAASTHFAPTLGALIPARGGKPLPLLERHLTSKEGLIIGRAAALAHLILDDPRTSRRHLRLRLTHGTLFAEDLNSTQGTAINGKPLAPFVKHKLQNGQILKIAEAEYKYKEA